MENMDIRNKIVDLRLKNYEVAREIGVTANTFCRWLQVPLTPVKRELIERTIRKLCEKNKEIRTCENLLASPHVEPLSDIWCAAVNRRNQAIIKVNKLVGVETFAADLRLPERKGQKKVG